MVVCDGLATRAASHLSHGLTPNARARITIRRKADRRDKNRDCAKLPNQSMSIRLDGKRAELIANRQIKMTYWRRTGRRNLW
jgi:hypothetical protein